MANTILVILSWLAQGSVIFPLVTSLIIKGKIPLPLKVVRLYLIFTFLVQAGITVLLVLHRNNLFLFHVYIIEAFILLTLFYRELLKKTYPFKDIPVKRRIFLETV